MIASGQLRDRFRFEARSGTGDEYGNPVNGGWTPQFTRAVQIKPMRGDEGVIAARLTGTQPIVIVTRYDTQTARIAPEWRAVDTRTNQTFAVRAVVDLGRKHEWLEITAVAGLAA